MNQPKPKPPVPVIHPDTLGVMGLYLKKQADAQFQRDLAQAMRAVKPKTRKQEK